MPLNGFITFTIEYRILTTDVGFLYFFYYIFFPHITVRESKSLYIIKNFPFNISSKSIRSIRPIIVFFSDVTHSLGNQTQGYEKPRTINNQSTGFKISYKKTKGKTFMKELKLKTLKMQYDQYNSDTLRVKRFKLY